MTTLVLLATRTPNPLTDELTLAGHRVFEALAISEVLALMEEHPEEQIVVAADVEAESAKVIQQRYPTMRLHKDAILKDILWELELPFIGTSGASQ